MPGDVDAQQKMVGQHPGRAPRIHRGIQPGPFSPVQDNAGRLLRDSARYGSVRRVHEQWFFDVVAGVQVSDVTKAQET